MPRFVLIDHSLCRVGGHEYDYAINVVRSAEADGYAVALGVNRRFRDRSGLPERWPVYPVFPHTAHTKHCVSMGGHDHLPMALDGSRLPLATDQHSARRTHKPRAGFGALTEFRRRWSRRHRIRGFARACRRTSAGSRTWCGAPCTPRAWAWCSSATRSSAHRPRAASGSATSPSSGASSSGCGTGSMPSSPESPPGDRKAAAGIIVSHVLLHSAHLQ